MNKLRKKIFILIFSILTLSLLGFITIFNAQNYIEQKNSIKENLKTATETEREKDNNKPPEIDNNKSLEIDNEKKDDNNINAKPNSIMFMDNVIYTILIDENNNIMDIINLSNNNINESEIKEIATEILNSDKLTDEYIGFLYLDDYSYSYFEGKSLTILDNSIIKSSLLSSLYSSIILFILLEIVIFFITKIITNWIVKPVQDSFEKQKQFIADASHELKTPLAVIMASSEAYEKYPKETKWLKNIKNEADRMSYLVNNLLELASSEKIETYNMEENDLSKVIELASLTFEGKAFENSIKLNYNITDNIKMKFDENQIKQLVEILLDNAIKHANKNSEITISLLKDGNNIKLLVTDIGDEIPKGEEDKIFERFYRVDKSRNRKENRYGLGLSIAKNITHNHNGSISAASKSGKTTFKVLFKK